MPDPGSSAAPRTAPSPPPPGAGRPGPAPATGAGAPKRSRVAADPRYRRRRGRRQPRRRQPRGHRRVGEDPFDRLEMALDLGPGAARQAAGAGPVAQHRARAEKYEVALQGQAAPHLPILADAQVFGKTAGGGERRGAHQDAAAGHEIVAEQDFEYVARRTRRQHPGRQWRLAVGAAVLAHGDGVAIGGAGPGRRRRAPAGRVPRAPGRPGRRRWRTRSTWSRSTGRR